MSMMSVSMLRGFASQHLARRAAVALAIGARSVAERSTRTMSTLSGTVVDRSSGLTSDQKMLLDMAENFAANELAPFGIYDV